MLRPPLSIVWYKRDFRVTDHVPLTAAIERSRMDGGVVVGLAVYEPRIWAAPDMSDRHRTFIAESLSDLEHSLDRLGISLLTAEAPLTEVLRIIAESYDIRAVYSHEETGTRVTYDRDIALSRYLHERGIEWHEFPTNGVVRRLWSRDDWGRIWSERMSTSVLPIPTGRYLGPRVWWLHLPLPRPITWETWVQRGGESIGYQVLDSFLQSRYRSYIGGMTRPDIGQSASSRLSPYITYGCLSLRSVYHATLRRRQTLQSLSDTYGVRSLDQFIARLHWQSHFIQKFETECRMETENLIPIYDTIRATRDDDFFEALESARTGIPYIDATVRQLEATGWINFRSRATLVSFVCNTAMQPWQGRFAHWLARLFLDYEPGIHYPQLQMQAGTTGINTIRIYNPVKQGKEKTGDGAWITRWLGELRGLPSHLISEPSQISPLESAELDWVLGRDYPRPILDIERANREARVILYGLRSQISRSTKAKVYDRHGSRKSPIRTRMKREKKKIPDNQSPLFSYEENSVDTLWSV